MAGLQFSFLLDEDTPSALVDHLEARGHDVERVVTVDELGRGSTDTEVRRYARETGRIVLAHDTDHVEPDAPPRVFLVPNQRLEAATIARAVDAVAQAFDTHDDLPAVVFLTEDWL